MKTGKKQISLPSGKKVGSTVKKVGSALKRNLFIICSVLLIGGAVYLNWAFFSDTPDNTVTATAAKTAVENKSGTEKSKDTEKTVNRQRARDESMQVLQSIIDNDDSEKTAKNDAYDGIAAIASEIEAESNIESLVVSKGFEDCVAVINGDRANIIVKSDGLLENEITQIQEIVFEQAGILPSQTKIIEKK